MSTGASNDLEKATAIATNMVTKYGMSTVGPITLGDQSGHEVFLGRDLGHVKNYSEDTARKVDAEIKRLLEEARDFATKTIKEKKELIKRITDELVKKETLSRADFLTFFGETEDQDDLKRNIRPSKKKKRKGN
jgi:cell division protease FtsH